MLVVFELLFELVPLESPQLFSCDLLTIERESQDLVYFIPAGLSAAAQATIFYVVFAVSLIGRPLGALIFGHFGDRVGRRQTTLISVAGFGIATLSIAALPGYAAWGEGAIAALILLRLLNGIFIGGEYTAANPLAMEYSPKDKRGLYAAIIHVGYPTALVCTALLAALMLKVAPGGDASSAYAVWGWKSRSSLERCSAAVSSPTTICSFLNPNSGAPPKEAALR
jgi:MFS family permease